ncbi:TPA: HNH endonuclease [Pseudomonas aeruginosa]|uniref:HNH endonuclease n=1 Tax=Pseudomonas aeruginosa TaxID=287 RepID=UPI000E317B2F|nr:HNH endonuclease [Pseudomonas aeruginosa]NPX94513.1 HNH endonuclease [Pseudomonas aeruginosa]
MAVNALGAIELSRLPPLPEGRPDAGLRNPEQGSWQARLGELQRQFPVPREYGETLESTRTSPHSTLVQRDGQTQELLPVTGSENAIRQYFAPAGEAERIARLEADGKQRVFAVSDRFYALPEHEIVRAERLAANAGIAIERLLPEPPRREIICRNENLEGDCHPVTGVPFERKVILVNGEEVEGVFAQFDSTCNVQLPEHLHEATNEEQFKYANEQLRQAVEADPELRAKFTDEQLEQIRNGDRPDGFVWHHSENPGELQLVDKETHDKTGHTGGQVVWGGGAANR